MAEISRNKLADSINEFALKLYKKSSSDSQNYFISPYSISTALSLCLPGARGETQSQLKKLLSLENYSDQDILDLNESFHTRMNGLASQNVALEMANKIYPKIGYELNQQYIDVVKKNFKSDIEPVNYGNASEAAGIINTWVAQKTQNKIKDLISPDVIDALTRIILVNAIYFKGTWVNKFDEHNTGPHDFHVTNSTKVKVDMMKIHKQHLKYLANPANLEACVVELPYMDHNVSMTIILPNANVSLSKIINDLNSSKIKEILESNSYGKVNVYLPKFKLELKKEISSDLIALGASLPFKEGEADFSGINPLKELFISKVIHQAVVEVNEQGTVAAAATAVIMTRCMAMPISREVIHDFICDRPFMFFIHDNKDKCLLFAGKYVQP